MELELKNVASVSAQIEGLKKSLDEVKKDVGVAMRYQRNKKGITLREFSRKIGVTASFVSDVERGRRFPSEEVLKKILKVLN